MSEKAAEIIMILFITVAYSYLIPYSTLVGILGVILRFGIEKTIILKMCQ